MAVISSGIWPIDPTVTSGSELAAFLNEFVAAFESSQASPSRPSVLERGGTWAKTMGASDIALMFFDGTTDHEIGSVVNGNVEFGGAVFNAGGTADRPVNPNDGDFYYDTDTNELLFGYQGGWISAGGNAVSIDADNFIGDGVTTDYTLSRDPIKVENTQVFIGGVYQDKSTYSVLGELLRFSEAPPDGISIEVVSQSAVELTMVDVGGGSLFKGNNGTVGDAAGIGDIFRVNAQKLLFDVTIDATENASCTGPLAIENGVVLTVTTGGNLSIV